MSSEPSKPSLWSRFTAPYRRLSLPARASLTLALFLIATIIIAWTAFALTPIHVTWRHVISWRRVFAVLTLAVLAPLTFYWALRLWLIGYRSRFPDIDVAWNAGLDALQRNSIPIRSTPVFLILGIPAAEVEDAIADACGREFAVRGVPEGPAPIHWYANAEAVFIVCSEVGWLSRINRVVHQQGLKLENAENVPIASTPAS